MTSILVTNYDTGRRVLIVGPFVADVTPSGVTYISPTSHKPIPVKESLEQIAHAACAYDVATGALCERPGEKRR